MKTTVRFDGLGLSFDIGNIAFQFNIGGHTFTIYWYGIIIAAGFALAIIYGLKRSKDFHIKTDPMIDVIIGGAIGSVICARLYYVLFSWDMYKNDWTRIFAIHEGGLAIYGGIIGAFLFGWLMCKWRKVNVLDMFDVGALGFLIGQGIGRWGNFFNQEAYGTTTNLPWAMKSDKIWNELTLQSQYLESQGIHIDLDALGVHPTFLYESIWCLLGFLLLHYISKKHRKFSGQIVLMYGVWYGAERFFVEGLRTDSLYIGGTTLRASQLLSLAIVIACIILLFVMYRRVKEKNREKEYVPVMAAEDEANNTLETSAAMTESETSEQTETEAHTPAKSNDEDDKNTENKKD